MMKQVLRIPDPHSPMELPLFALETWTNFWRSSLWSVARLECESRSGSSGTAVDPEAMGGRQFVSVMPFWSGIQIEGIGWSVSSVGSSIAARRIGLTRGLLRGATTPFTTRRQLRSSHTHSHILTTTARKGTSVCGCSATSGAGVQQINSTWTSLPLCRGSAGRSTRNSWTQSSSLEPIHRRTTPRSRWQRRFSNSSISCRGPVLPVGIRPFPQEHFGKEQFAQSRGGTRVSVHSSRAVSTPL